MALLQVLVQAAQLLSPVAADLVAAEDYDGHDVHVHHVEDTVLVVESFPAGDIVLLEVDTVHWEGIDHEEVVDYDFRAGCDYHFADGEDNYHVSD